MTPEVEFWGTPHFFTKIYFFGPALIAAGKGSQNGPKTHLGLLPLLQQCSGDGTSIPLNSPTVVAVEILLPEHCCSYGSKPGWFWASFWLFLTAENQAGPKKDFFVKKMGIWGSTIVAVEIRLAENC